MSQLYKPESFGSSAGDDCEELTEDLLESTSVFFFLRVKILPASEEDPPTSDDCGLSHSDDLFCKSWLNSSVPRALKRKQDTNFSAFDFEPRTQKWNHVPISRTDVGFRNKLFQMMLFRGSQGKIRVSI